MRKAKKNKKSLPSFIIRAISPNGAKIAMCVYNVKNKKAALSAAKKRTGKSLRREKFTLAARRKIEFDVQPLVIKREFPVPDARQYISFTM